ncbi:hypothetical protein AB2M62_12870 [Sphingomonas sp. MMS12-HWE2-04]|uniref:hypothetical protein n=1 Tax=Sphingomonas sp. MMS12-HWE2-04 TaxID=3234199 RepID=UPI00384DF7DD
MQALPFETPTQIAALVLALVAGWFFGLATRSGGGRWRDRYQDEEVAHRTYRERADTQIRDDSRRIRELEAEVARLRGQTSVVPDAVPPRQASRSWFGWGRDNLARIRGVDATLEQRLNDTGIKTYAEIENLSPADEDLLEDAIGVRRGTVKAEAWREQAALLRAGNDEEHARRFA